MDKFEKLLGKENPLFKAVIDRGFKAPTEIQEKSIPQILEGKDVIGGASTGSGKTLAFTSGLVKNVKKDFGIQGLVLTPTRELAEQVSEEVSDFASLKGLNVIAIYGGVSINDQQRRLPSAEIVVGTPGRVLDHIGRNSIDLSRVNTLVLDEADRMLDMGFIDDVKKIIAECPNKRQTLLFSATISPDISHLADRILKDPVMVSATPHVDPKKLEQVFYDVQDNLKFSLLKHLLENEKSDLVMVFCNTRRNVDFVSKNLGFMGVKVLPLHGGFSQDKRSKMLESFENDKKRGILIATDVAARGLDIPGVSHVYNYDIPPTKNEYVHRIGRTARAGQNGKVVNILASKDYDNFQAIINSEDFKVKQLETPYVKRSKMRWMPETKQDRFNRRRDMRRQGGRGDRRDNRRNDDRRDNRRRDDRRDSGKNRGYNKQKDFHRRKQGDKRR